jgi:hypothetical protein
MGEKNTKDILTVHLTCTRKALYKHISSLTASDNLLFENIKYKQAEVK